MRFFSASWHPWIIKRAFASSSIVPKCFRRVVILVPMTFACEGTASTCTRENAPRLNSPRTSLLMALTLTSRFMESLSWLLWQQIHDVQCQGRKRLQLLVLLSASCVVYSVEGCGIIIFIIDVLSIVLLCVALHVVFLCVALQVVLLVSLPVIVIR
jgi:hypothetical protein